MVNILVVDDDLIFGKNFAAILKERGYAVELAETGNEAISLLQETFFNVVFLDIRLPDINGTEVYKQIMQINPRTNVIIISAFSLEDVARDLIRERQIQYFSKPFDIDSVIRTVAEISG